jgi:putative NADH-flavin reductase
MKLAILGASGGCGAQLVSQALARGHEVTAVVRSTSWQPPAGARVMRGNLTNADFLRTAVKGQDAVLSALGLRIRGLAPWNKPEQADFLVRSTTALLEATKAEGVGRLEAISAAGVGDSRDAMPGVFKAMLSLTSLKYAYAELEKMERLMLDSGLDVCLCRPSGLTDGPATGKVQVAQRFSGRPTISRADVAAWMLDQLEQRPFPHRTPMISVTGVA